MVQNAEAVPGATKPGAVKRVVIAGGGTAGWVAAMALSRQFGTLLDITLVESDDIGTIGVGESTVPPIVAFHRFLGIDEREFMRECAATFKVAIWFENFGKIGDWYLHPFGRHGQPTWVAEFYNYWLQARSQGLKVPLGEYPELTARGIPPTGTENYGGPVVTAGGLIFIGASADETFRAFDRKTGALLWQARLPFSGTATPSTYLANGRQYVVISAGGGKSGRPAGGTVVAFALPTGARQ